MKVRKFDGSLSMKIAIIVTLFIHIAALVAIPEPNIKEYNPNERNSRERFQTDINVQVDFQQIEDIQKEIDRQTDIIEDVNNSGDIILSDSGDTMLSNISADIFDIDTTSIIPVDTYQEITEYVETYEVPPQPISLAEPRYPTAALNNSMEGNVVLFLYVDIDGTVAKAEVINSSNPLFNESAIEAGLKCTFKPAESLGRPVRVKIVFPVNFKLN